MGWRNVINFILLMSNFVFGFVYQMQSSGPIQAVQCFSLIQFFISACVNRIAAASWNVPTGWNMPISCYTQVCRLCRLRYICCWIVHPFRTNFLVISIGRNMAKLFIIKPCWGKKKRLWPKKVLCMTRKYKTCSHVLHSFALSQIFPCTHISWETNHISWIQF